MKSDNAAFPSRPVTVTIARDVHEVYDFASNPLNLPQWASGLGDKITRDDDYWIVQSEQGPLKLQFAPANDYGVLDHYVTAPGSEELYMPMRVIRNGSHADVMFTLFKYTGMTDAQFEADAEIVRGDLMKLKALLEKQ